MGTREEKATRGAGPRRVLLVACAFPPTGGPGVQRSAKFAKYLPQFGWLPTVWTVEHMDGFPRDPTLLAAIPAEVKIHRRGSGGAAHSVRRCLKELDGEGFASRAARAASWRLDAWLQQRGLPDCYESWARRSVRPLRGLIEKEGIDVVFTTISPESAHLVGLALKRRIGIPWVADFRDLWTDDYRYREKSPRRRIAKRRMEQEILETADVVIGVSERQTEILADHVPSQRHKFVTITNGFDPDDFPEVAPAEKAAGAPFVLLYAGRLDRWRASEAWFDGLQLFARRLGDNRQRFTFRLIGHAGADTRARLRETGIRCEFTGYVPHVEAVGEMRSADALLLSVPEGPNADSTIPAKLFEYLAAGRPILAVGPPDGQCELIIKQCEAGPTSGFDGGKVAEALAQLFGAWEAGRPIPGCRPEHLEPFNRVNLTCRLASVLNALVGVEPESGCDPDALLDACLI